VRLDVEVLHAGMRGQGEGDEGLEAATAALLVEDEGDGGGTRGFPREGLLDGGGERGRAIVVEQVREAPQLRDAGIAARRPLGEEPIEARDRLP